MATAVKGIFIVGAKRTPFGAFGGVFVGKSAADLQTTAAVAALKQGGVSPDKVDSINIGNVMPSTASDGGFLPRHVGLRAGVPIDKPALGINRLCGSGFQAVVNGAQDILTGVAKISLVGGTENISQSPFIVRNIRFGTSLGTPYVFEDAFWSSLIDTYCKLTIGLTAEKLGEQFKISREETDKFALSSQQKWKAGFDAGAFNDEIVPVAINTKGKDVEITKDENPKPQMTLEELAEFPPVFKKNGLITVGSASGVSDGAGALVIASEEAVNENSLTPLARLTGWSIVGVEPSIMGIGPVNAIQNLLKVTKLTLNDIDLVEINETFAVQALACAKGLNLDLEKLNVNGGALAIGYPLAASGARITAHLVHELKRRGLKKGIGSACIGGGQGIALLIEIP